MLFNLLPCKKCVYMYLKLCVELNETATMGGLSLAGGGWTMNLMVYLIQEFNVKSIDAAQIFNIVNGCTALFPILGAIVADSFLGCFSVIWISSLFSLLVSTYVYYLFKMYTIIIIFYPPLKVRDFTNYV